MFNKVIFINFKYNKLQKNKFKIQQRLCEEVRFKQCNFSLWERQKRFGMKR